MGIGMDDPLLAEQLKRTALAASGDGVPTPLTYRIAANDVAKPVDALLEADREERAKSEGQSRPKLLRELLVVLLLILGSQAGDRPDALYGGVRVVGPALWLDLHTMDASEALNTATGNEAPPAMWDCPHCGEPPSGPPAVTTTLFELSALRRCVRCGSRYAASGAELGVVLDCAACGLPFLDASGKGQVGTACPDCNLGRVPPDLPDAVLAGATEREVQLALESRWRFLSSRPAAIYLNKVLRQVVKRFNGARGNPRVILFEDPALRTLALPSGMILLSQGSLDELEDEAQLAFVLAHELAHAFSGDAARRLVRLGFHAVAHEGEAQEEAAWADAAEDLVRLGYGRERERQADARALEAVLAVGYDPRSVVHYLQHLESLGERGDEKVADLFLSHPPAGDRLRRVEETLARHVDSKATRLVNREVFRRAAGRHASTVETAALSDLTTDQSSEPGAATVLDAVLSKLPWIAVAAVLVTALILIFGFLL
jgi:hypothetical protein